MPFAANVIVELLKTIVAGSAPRPFTFIALLNQIELPSAIGVGLKLNSIELISVHEPALTAEVADRERLLNERERETLEAFHA